MKNKEKYVDELVNALFEHQEVNICRFVNKYAKTACSSFQSCEECCDYLKQWLEEEHKEQPLVSEKEYAVLSSLNETICVFIGRDGEGELFFSQYNPYIFGTNNKNTESISKTYVSWLRGFEFIQKFDYYKIEDLLNYYKQQNGGTKK